MQIEVFLSADVIFHLQCTFSVRNYPWLIFSTDNSIIVLFHHMQIMLVVWKLKNLKNLWNQHFKSIIKIVIKRNIVVKTATKFVVFTEKEKFGANVLSQF